MLTYARNYIFLKLGERTLDPRLAIYYVTEKCNLNCTYCEDFGLRRNHEFISPNLEDAKKILTIIRDGKTFTTNVVLTHRPSPLP